MAKVGLAKVGFDCCFNTMLYQRVQEALQKAESTKRAEVERLARRKNFSNPQGSIKEPKIHEIGGDGPPFCTVPRKPPNSCWSDPPNGEQWEKTYRQTSRISFVGWSPSNWSCEMLSRWATSASSKSCPSCSPRERSGLTQVPPLQTTWGWRGVQVGEASNPGPSKHEAPADWQNHCRTQTVLEWMCQPPEGGTGVCERCLGLGTVIQTKTDQCRPRLGGSCPVTQVDASSDKVLVAWKACGP